MPTEETIMGIPGAAWLAVLLAICSAVFVWRIVALVRVLAQGGPDHRLNDIPLRIFTFCREVLGQSRLIRGESIINWAHPLVFWGFCLFVVASALMFVGGIAAPWLHVPQVEEIPILGTLVDLFAVLVLVGLIAASVRRYVLTPDRLQRTADATIVVLLIAALMVTFLLAEAGGHAEGKHQTWLPAGVGTARLLDAMGMPVQTIAHTGIAAWWIHVGILLTFLVYLPFSKHMHLIWAPFAVFFAELPHKGTLPDADEEQQLPDSRLGQLTWRSLLCAYACAECGRCDRVCPAVASGSKLSPQTMIHGLKDLIRQEGAAARGGGNGGGGNGGGGNGGGGNGGGGKQLVADLFETNQIWSCATCYACMDVCPVRNEHVPLIVQLRRQLVAKGELDAGLQEALMSLQRYGNSLGKSPRKRVEWTKVLPAPVPDARKQPVEYLWFLGDYAAYHPSSARVSALVARLFQSAGLDFGALHRRERSAGNDARRVGEEGLFQMLAEQNMQELEAAQFETIVTTDPHSYHTLKHEYRRFGLNCPVVHYSEVLDGLLHAGRLKLSHRLQGRAVYHDPCYLGRYNGVYDPPRRVIDALGLQRCELPRNREHSFCCGAGGGKIWMNEEEAVSERPAVNRIREALDMPGVTRFVVACPKDLGMFEDAVKTVGAEDRLQVVDLGELVFEAVQPTANVGAET